MNANRTRRQLTWDALEDRLCPAPFVGPLPYMPPSIVPAQRTELPSTFLQGLFVKQAAAWSPQVAFYGDSIMYNFGFYLGHQAWTQTIAPLDAQDYGEPADSTQNILWRVENGELPARPRVIVLEAGSNNLGTDGESPQDTLLGIENLVNAFRALSPTSKILLVGMIPVGGPANRFRPEIVEINAQLARFVDNQNSFFLDVSPSMLAPDQTLTAVDEPDLVHPNALGYQIWAADMIGMLDKLLGIVPRRPRPRPSWGRCRSGLSPPPARGEARSGAAGADAIRDDGRKRRLESKVRSAELPKILHLQALFPPLSAPGFPLFPCFRSHSALPAPLSSRPAPLPAINTTQVDWQPHQPAPDGLDSARSRDPHRSLPRRLPQPPPDPLASRPAMNRAQRRRRPLAWEHLEDRLCPAPFVGPLPSAPASIIPTQRTDPVSIALQNLYAHEAATWSPQVVFVGDSFTYNFAYAAGSQVWGRSIAGLDAADYGIPSDATQNILWRVENGELPAHPKVVVLQAGANNLGTDLESPEDTLAGIENLVDVIHALSPTSKILVVGIFPVGEPTDPIRPVIAQINGQLARFVDDRTSFFLDVGPSLLGPGGTLTAVAADSHLVHLNALGYQDWAAAMIGPLRMLLGVDPSPTAVLPLPMDFGPSKGRTPICRSPRRPGFTSRSSAVRPTRPD